jgi:hypothetical protein
MSNPPNKLDKYTSYTYHFELHSAKSWNTLALLENVDKNMVTSVREVNETLFINTRKDAHQTIDNVKFSYSGPSSTNNGMFTPYSKMTFEVYEPNGMYFVEKIANFMSDQEISNPLQACWALKIFFVGRLPDNSIETVPLNGILIPLVFLNMTSEFTHQGGKYEFEFSCAGGWAGQIKNPTPEQFTNSLLLGYCDTNISISARTIKEALKDLEKKLNSNYDKKFEDDLKKEEKRKIKYFIKCSQEIDGQLTLNQVEDWSPDAPSKLNFNSKDPILSWIYSILRSSKEMNEKISESFEAIKKPNHEGVKMIVVLPTAIYKDDCLELVYDILMYEGGSDYLEFDFLFADPGKNVDVISFNMKMQSLGNWFSSKNENSTSLEISNSPTVASQNPKVFKENVVTPDKSTDKLYVEKKQTTIPGLKGDIAIVASNAPGEDSGFIRHRHDAVPAAKMMFATVTAMQAAYNPEIAFVIRGNLDLLKAGITYPNGGNDIKRFAFGITAPLWLKVNIHAPDGTPFFYTGKYNLLTIENHFTGGKFLQTLYTFMSEQVDPASSTGQAAAKKPENNGLEFRQPINNINGERPR